MLIAVIRVPPLDQNASKGSGVGTTAVPVAGVVESNRRTFEPAPIPLSVPAFQSAIVSSLASSWQSTIHAVPETLELTALFHALSIDAPSASLLMKTAA